MTGWRKRMFYKTYRVVLPLVAFLAVLPLLIEGPTCGHDLGFHLLSWMEAARSFAHGDVHPAWISAAAYNAGEPRFIFYPPVSWTMGGLLTLAVEHVARAVHIGPGSAFALVPIIYTWIALTAAGFGMHRVVRCYAGPRASLFVSVLYLANPYTLFTAYERTAFAELLAAALLPLLLGAVLEGRVRVAKLGLVIALLWVTNAPAAVMGCYAVALIAAVRTAMLLWRAADRGRALRFAVQICAATLFGLGLASFYLVPAAYERRWVEINMAVLPGLRVEDNTIFHHFGESFHDAVNHTVSVVALLIAAFALTALATNFGDEYFSGRGSSGSEGFPSHERAMRVSLFALVVAILFLLTPLSLRAWHDLPELAFLQFPWRLLAVLASAVCMLLALALGGRGPLRWPAGIVALGACALGGGLIFPAYTGFHQTCELDDAPATLFADFSSGRGAEPTDEYTPEPADNDDLRPDNPAYQISGDPSAPAPENAHSEPAPRHLDLSLRTPAYLILNLRDYPAWRVTRNGNFVPDRVSRDDGLLVVPLPAGLSHIDLAFAETPDRIAGDLLSVVAVLFLLALALMSRRTPSSRRGRAEDAPQRRIRGADL